MVGLLMGGSITKSVIQKFNMQSIQIYLTDVHIDHEFQSI